MKQYLQHRTTIVIGILFVLLTVVAWSMRPQPSTVTTPTSDQFALMDTGESMPVAILPPLDERLIPFPDEDEAAFDASQDPDGGPRQAFEWFWRQRAYPLTTVPFDANGRALAQARAAAETFIQSADVQQLNWQSVGPAPLQGAWMGSNSNGDVRTTAAGRVTAIEIPANDSNTLYVATSTGGIWKSTDGGANFVPLTNTMAEYAFQSLAIDPQNTNTIYAGTGQFSTFYGTGLLKSTDGGQTWTALGKNDFGPLMITGIYVHPGDSNTVVVTTSNLGQLETAGQLPGQVPDPGIYRSADGGATWTLVQSCDPCARGFSDLVMDATNPQQPAFYAANAGVGIYKSVDAGVTWQKLAAFDTALGRVAYGRTVLAIGGGAGVGTVYAGLDGQARDGRSGIVMRTTDGGQTWAEVPAARGFCDGQCFHDIVIGVNPQNTNDVFFGGVNMLRTTDGGATVNNISSLNGQDVGLHVDHHVITFDPNNPNIVWNGNDGGVYRFDGTTWEARNNGMATLQFIGIGVNPVDASQALGGMQDNSQAFWDGDNWQGFDFADGNKGEWDPFNVNIVYYGDQNISFRVSEQANINALRNSGQNRLNGINGQDQALFYIPFELDPVREGVLYLGTDKLYRSTDRALNWQPISQAFDATVKSIGIARSDGNIVYVGTANGQILQGVQQGGQWTFTNRTAANLPGRVLNDIVISPADANTVYIVFNGFSQNTPGQPGHVFKSTDGGANWARLDGTGQAVIPDIPVLSILLDPDNAGHIYVGTDIGVFHSTNDGQTWVNASQGLPPVPVYDLKYVGPVKQLWAATYGRSIWRTSLGAPVPNPTPTPTLVPTNTPVNPTDTPEPTSTPMPPASGAWPGEWDGDVAFLVAEDQTSLYNLQVFVTSENNCQQTLGATGPIQIAGDGSFTYTFQERDTSWSVTGTIDGESATGTATFNNFIWETSMCGDPLTGTFDWASDWFQSAPDPTPTPLPTATPTPQATGGINGQVLINGQGIADINLWLAACPNNGECNAETDAPAAQTRTDAGGYYNFGSAPTLPADQFYFVLYLNDESAGNTTTDTYLYRWYGPFIDQYTAGSAADGGSFDISDIVLLTPEDGAGTLPVQFTWQQRTGLTENYVWTLYSEDSGTEICRGPSSNAADFTLTKTYLDANCPQAASGGSFDWFVWAINGTDLDNDPAGDSFFVGQINLFTDGAQNLYLPFVQR